MRSFRAGAFALCLLLSFGLSLSRAADIQIPPSPSRWATDTAGFLSAGALDALDQKLEAYAQQTGHQVIVYIGGTTGGYPIEEFAAKAFEAWKVGRQGLDDGLALFIMAEDRAVRIEVGYGLESIVPDITAGRIINDILIPKVRAGDTDGAVSDAVAAILAAISGEAVPIQESKRPGQGSARAPFIIFAVIIFAIIFLTSPSLALWLLVNILGGGSHGSGGGSGSIGRVFPKSGSSGGWRSGSGGGGFRSSGGGGFRGGGGRSGGGGASGRW
ncbi:MAG: hypothetical protein H6P98_678 [Candidatus Aminicenantes bacterium]|nr:hypothetical protein [Candidatus Aminicenantes bacterium]